MKIAVVGSRDYPNEALIRWLISIVPDDTEIVSGAARGVDSIAAAAAKERGLKLTEFPADWNTFGKSAGFRRNVDIVKYADLVAAFWDGSSKGTKHTIDTARKEGKRGKIYYADGRVETL